MRMVAEARSLPLPTPKAVVTSPVDRPSTGVTYCVPAPAPASAPSPAPAPAPATDDTDDRRKYPIGKDRKKTAILLELH